MHIYIPSTTVINGSLPLTALVSFLPLVVFFVMLGVFKIKTHWCALGSLALAILIAILGMRMPVLLAASTTAYGAAFGVFPILFIVITAVWLYKLTEVSGRERDMRVLFSVVGRGDTRVQALLVGFSFCGLLEGLAGFGAPVAISCAMLLALGLRPLKAALVAMVGNSLNVCYGAMAIPITTAGSLGGSDPLLVGATSGRITPFLISWTPLLLLLILDGIRGLRQAWPAAIAAGLGMAAGHYLCSNFLSYELTAVVGSLLSFAVLVLFMQFWRPTTPAEMRSQSDATLPSLSRSFLALAPYCLVVVIFAVAKLWKIGLNIPQILAGTKISFPWPGVYKVLGTLENGKAVPSKSGIFGIDTLNSPGTMLALTAIIISLIYAAYSTKEFPFQFGQGLKTLVITIYGLRLTIVTICAVMALAYVMNFSGQTLAIGTLLSKTGAWFALLSPVLGWIGTAVTGSATSAGALFAKLQAAAGSQAHISNTLLLSANEIGGGIGKIISPQNLAIAATAVEEPGMESEILRKALPWSVGLLMLLGLIVMLASVNALGFLVAV